MYEPGDDLEMKTLLALAGREESLAGGWLLAVTTVQLGL